MKLFRLLLIVFAVSVWAVSAQAQVQKYSRIKINTTEQAELSKLSRLPISDSYRLEKNNVIGEFSETEMRVIKNAGFEYEVLIDDLSRFYAERNLNAPLAQRSERTPENFNLGSMGGNLTHDELLAELDDMFTLFPDLITEKQPITTEYTTHEGNYIYWVHLTSDVNPEEDKPDVLFTGLHHAREPVSMMQQIYLMWYLMENYENGGEAQYLVDNFDIYFIPCVNPDGYMYNESIASNGGGMWRKNMRDNDNNGTFNEYDDGVDINRNYPYEWGYDNSGSSPYPGDATYRGPSAASEPETQMVMEFTNARNIITANNHHTYSRLLLYPWGYESILSPHEDVFDTYAEVMTRVNNYTCGHGWEVLYNTNGGTNDWMYGEHEILVFTAETGDEFWPSSSEIIPLCEENMEMNLFLIRLAGSYAEVQDLNPAVVSKHGHLKFSVNFLGQDIDRDFTIRIESEAFETAPEPFVFEAGSYDVLDTHADSVFYFLKEEYQAGDQFTYTLTADNGMFEYSQEITKTIGKTEIAFFDEGNDMDNWTTTNWDITDESYYSPSYSICDSEGGEYENNQSNYITLSFPVSISDGANLSFYAKWQIESGWDYAQIEISDNGGSSWTPLMTDDTGPGGGSGQPDEPLFDGTSDWAPQTSNLNAYAGDDVLFRFGMISDGSITYDGFYFDDFAIMTVSTENIAPEIMGNLALELTNDTMFIPFESLIINDPDNTYPNGYMMMIEAGDHYTVTEGGVVPEEGYAWDLEIPVRVHDGLDYSNLYVVNPNGNWTATGEMLSTEIILAPNPAKDFLNVHAESGVYQSYMITDVSGRVVASGIIRNNETNIQTSDWAEGIYFIRLSGQQNTVKKIMIVK